MPNRFTILGIDPGLAASGWGIVQTEGSALHFIDSGTIKTSSKAPLSERLMQIHTVLENVITNHNITHVALEETFQNSNPQSSLKLGHARGVAMLTAGLHNLPCHEVSATHVKKTITGNGRASKEQIMMMVKVLLPKAQFDSDHAADALAIAICGSRS